MLERNFISIRTLATAAMLIAAAGCEMMNDDADRVDAAAQPAARQIRAAQPGPERLSELKNHHADLTARITAQDINQLNPAWRIETGQNVSHTPLVQGDRVYFADWGGTVYAADRNTGQIIWQNKIENPKPWPWHGFAGTGAIEGNTLYEASVEGNAFAIDVNSGQVKWKKRIADDEQAGSLAKILVHDGLVYIGLQSVEEPLSQMKENFEVNFRGKVMALDAQTGELVWERQLVEAPHNGVPVWSGFALDPELKTLYFTTGNNYTGEATPLSDSIVAADARTGRIKWHRQVTAHDVWTMAEPKGPDYDFGAAPQLFEARIDGQERQLVGAGQKSGTFYVWDRRTGEPVWTTTVGYGQVGGGIHAEASIGDGRIYLWGNNAYPYSNPQQHPMDIKAVDAASGEYLWVKTKAQPAVLISSGFLANDVYFVGSLDGKVRGYRASDGKHIWTSQEHGSVSSPLWVDGQTLMWGTGVPKNFGGKGTGGALIAYQIGADGLAGAPATQPAEAQPAAAEEQPATQPAGQPQSNSGQGAGDAQPQAAQDGQQQGEARRIEVIATEFDFDPSQITAQPGQPLEIVLINRGDRVHNIEFHLPQGREIAFEQVVPPGERKTLQFTAPQQPGEYVYYCPVDAHRSLGMEGTLIVQPQP